jgi:hypothetical protein
MLSVTAADGYYIPYIKSEDDGMLIPDSTKLTLTFTSEVNDYSYDFVPVVDDGSEELTTCTIEVSSAEGYDFNVDVSIGDAGKILPKHTIAAVMTKATTTNELPATVKDGEDYTLVIDADTGTSFENVMFVLDKGTSNEAQWVVDLDDEVNIFDQTIANVPHIDNEGKIVRTREGDHYRYTVYLTNIQNDYEVRFSTLTINAD